MKLQTLRLEKDVCKYQVTLTLTLTFDSKFENSVEDLVRAIFPSPYALD